MLDTYPPPRPRGPSFLRLIGISLECAAIVAQRRRLGAIPLKTLLRSLNRPRDTTPHSWLPHSYCARALCSRDTYLRFEGAFLINCPGGVWIGCLCVPELDSLARAHLLRFFQLFRLSLPRPLRMTRVLLSLHPLGPLHFRRVGVREAEVLHVLRGGAGALEVV